MISKESFIEYIEKLKDLNDSSFNLYKFGVDLDVLSDSISLSYDILRNIFQDESDWIDYFCCELDYGNKYKDGMINDKDGNNISMKDSGELYDILIENMQ